MAFSGNLHYNIASNNYFYLTAIAVCCVALLFAYLSYTGPFNKNVMHNAIEFRLQLIALVRDK